MMLCIYYLLWGISLTARWTSSQEMECLTVKARDGYCVWIVNCPAMQKLANSSVRSERKYFHAHLCGDQKVCCDKRRITTATTTTTTTSTTTTTTTTSTTTIEPYIYDYVKLFYNDKIYCGMDFARERIIGGEMTDINQFRWTVALDFDLPSKKGVRCVGSLITTRYVLTAANCVYSTHEHELTLRLGDWNIEQDPDCDMDGNCNEEAKFVNVSRIIIHPEYKRDRTGSKVNDIALLRMENALPENYTNYILPICMPTSVTLMQDVFANRNVSTVGWRLAVPETRNRYKMYSEIKTISNHKCEKELEKPIRDSKMCAKPLSGKYSDVCGSDSGSPLQIQINGTYFLIGIVSYGPRCGLPTLPVVYTRVTSYMAWISENITD